MRRLVAILAALTLTATACVGGENGESDGQSSSPIADFLGEESFPGGNEIAAERQFIEQEQARQEAIASCMQALGFEYIALVPPNAVLLRGASGEEWGSARWTATYGFGITTQAFAQSQVGADLVGFDDQQFHDPNQILAEALPGPEQASYHRALHGGDGSCAGEASAEDKVDRFYQQFGDELDAMYQRVKADPRIRELEEEVGDCVAEAGLDYSGMAAVHEDFEKRLTRIEAYGRGFFGFGGEDLTEQELAAMSEEEQEALFDEGPPALSEADRAILAELQADEIELAQAVDNCGGGFADQQQIFVGVASKYERDFLDDNAGLLAGFEAD